VSNIEDVLIPDLSGSDDVDVVEVLVNVGDSIEEGDSLLALETDKASMEVPAPKGGVVKEIIMQEGSTCNEGDLILKLEVGGAAEAPAPVVVEEAPAAAPAPAPAPAAPAAASAVEEVRIPDLSGSEDVDVVEVLVKAGDSIEEGDSLIALETDKASMEVPAPKGGIVQEVIMTEGGTCNEGDLILMLSVGGAAPAPVAEAPAPAAESAASAPVAAPVAGGVEDVLVPDHLFKEIA